jgi:ABC-type phosphate transport system substrate-binding protein
MKKIALNFASVIALTLLAQTAQASDVVVIANTGVSLSANEVRDVFLGDKQFAGSTKLTPVDNSAAQENFLSKVLQISSAKYASTWTKKAFRDGLTAPATKSSDAEVIEFVKRTKGAVGYVSSSPSGVNIIK